MSSPPSGTPAMEEIVGSAVTVRSLFLESVAKNEDMSFFLVSSDRMITARITGHRNPPHRNEIVVRLTNDEMFVIMHIPNQDDAKVFAHIYDLASGSPHAE